jgi:hypothetical protein
MAGLDQESKQIRRMAVRILPPLAAAGVLFGLAGAAPTQLRAPLYDSSR